MTHIRASQPYRRISSSKYTKIKRCCMLNSELLIVFIIYFPESVDFVLGWLDEMVFRPVRRPQHMPCRSEVGNFPTTTKRIIESPLPVHNVPPSTTSHAPTTSSLSSMSIPCPSP